MRGGSKSTALNDAVTALSKSGVFVAVAAGNENADSCKESPASATPPVPRICSRPIGAECPTRQRQKSLVPPPKSATSTSSS